VLLGAVFVWQETRAAEPIVPLTLFRNDVVSVTSVIGFVLGTVMFGSTIYIPLYLQIVKNYTPTDSGLRMLPLMLGIAISSITSGRLISRFNRYKIFPILGTAIFTVGLGLLSRLGADTGAVYASAAMFVVGAGVGLVMQVLMVAVQNAVDFSVLGVATSTSTFFRSMGGTFGIAVLGAVLSSRLGDELAKRIPAAEAAKLGDPAKLENPVAIIRLPEPVHSQVVESFAHALQSVFLWSMPIAAVAFVFALVLREVPLRGRAPMPTQRAEGEAGEVTTAYALD
jgi:MFS family permease